MRYWQEHEPSDPRGYYYSHPPQQPRTVTWLILINVIVFLIQGFDRRSPFIANLVDNLALYPPAVFIQGHVWQLITYAFLHAGIFHIVMNMYVLYLFGSEVEAVWGRTKFLIFYFAAAVFSGLCYSGIHFLLHDDRVCVGASGAIMAVMMVYAMWWPNRIILFMFLFPMRMVTFAILIAITETIFFLQGEQGVANLAHLGGLAFGYFVVMIGHMLSVRTVTHSTIRNPSERDERHLDELLAKIQRDGMKSLNWWQRRFLKKFKR